VPWTRQVLKDVFKEDQNTELKSQKNKLLNEKKAIKKERFNPRSKIQ
jgi:hypothetical protein